MKRDKPLHIGYSCLEAREVYIWSHVGHALQEEGKNLDIKTTVSGVSSVEEQLQIIDKLVAQNVDALIISPIVSDFPGFGPLLAKIRARHIPIVLIGSTIKNMESLPLVASDHVGGQVTVTDAALRHLGG